MTATVTAAGGGGLAPDGTVTIYTDSNWPLATASLAGGSVSWYVYRDLTSLTVYGTLQWHDDYSCVAISAVERPRGYGHPLSDSVNFRLRQSSGALRGVQCKGQPGFGNRGSSHL